MRLITFITTLLLAFVIMPIGNVHAALTQFSDVSEKHSNYEDIMYLLEKGIVEPSKTYGVNDIVTREEVAVMIAKAIGLSGTQRPTKFSDVPEHSPYSGYIQSAVEQGIIKGYDDGTFKPNVKVTRGHMATFIARAFNLPSGKKTFKDVPKNSTAYEAVQQLVAAGITNGYEDGTFRPSDNLTRGHISAFLARAHKYENANEEKVTVEEPLITEKPYIIDLDYLTDKEKELAASINEYRESLGLKPFTISRSLTTVARAHVIDSNNYSPSEGVDQRGIDCNLHSWSASGSWSPVCYTSDHQYAKQMWDKPRELTSYNGNGYEISASARDISPSLALDLWKNSTGHNNVIIGAGSWSTLTVMGVGINGDYAHVWFGKEPDHTLPIE
ncbi:S-layer homology domain-containing protein [Lysinibacillus xylanilyticus]|uniref:CAP and S-layer homology domain-containing protein n=1 Tax=Lysinibacillus xylanilyticus TaxID=582475 RepID=UPI00380BF6D1